MARIVDDLLLLARLEKGMLLRAEPVEVELVVREALLRAMLLAPRRRPRRGRTRPLRPRADSERLLQALTNLVANAVKHTEPDDAIVLTAARENGHALVRVADSGCGIPPAELPRVFERFYRGADQRADTPRRAPVSGLRSRALVEAMHGAIDVDSSPGVGTTFTLRLPIWTKSTPAA